MKSLRSRCFTCLCRAGLGVALLLAACSSVPAPPRWAGFDHLTLAFAHAGELWVAQAGGVFLPIAPLAGPGETGVPAVPDNWRPNDQGALNLARLITAARWAPAR